MTRVIIVRHGQSEGNVAHCFASHTDVKLTEIGRTQAKAVAAELAATERIDAVYASDLSRAYDTVAPTAARFGLTVIPDPVLREIRAGDWENQLYTELEQNPAFAADYATWKNDLPRCRCTGGESVAELYDRVVGEVLKIAARHDGKTVLIGTHWTPVAAVLSYAMCGSVDGMSHRLNPINAALQVFSFEDGKLTLLEMNRDEHLKNAGFVEPYKP